MPSDIKCHRLSYILIFWFSQDPYSAACEVAERAALPADAARKKLGLWVSKGVLREENGVFTVQETFNEQPSAPEDVRRIHLLLFCNNV